MKKPLVGLIYMVIAGLWLVVSNSCDRSSQVGSSIRPESDIVSVRIDSLPLQVETVALDSIYSRSTYTLLGELEDLNYGAVRASYVSRVQHAPGFKFSHQPLEEKIDSVIVSVAYMNVVGDTMAWNKVNVYEVQHPLPKSRYSAHEAPYVKDAILLGSATHRAARTKSIRVRVPNEVGERFYNASKNNPEYFTTQEALEENLLRGLYVKASSGTGALYSVYATDLEIYYSYRFEGKTEAQKDTVYNKVGVEVFSNTKNLYTHNLFEHERVNDLLSAQAPYTYIKAPAGVVTKISLSRDALARVYAHYQGKEQRDRWLVNSAAVTIESNLPEGFSHLNPPMYLLLVPQDSLAQFFERPSNELIKSRLAFVSTIYNIAEKNYQFPNMATLVDAHLKNHARVDAQGQAVVDADLNLLLVPVQLSMLKDGNTIATVTNYLYPAAIRLYFPPEKSFLTVSSTGYKE